MNAEEWVMSMQNPTHVKYEAHRLWKQGLRAGDKTIIVLQYGYSDSDADILCEKLADMERIANNILKDYNPDLGF